jgi:fatty-acyl-CoA synthase
MSRLGVAFQFCCATTNMGRDELLWNRWASHAQKMPEKEAIVHWQAGEEPFRWTFSSLLSAAERFSVALRASGVMQGDVCALIIRHNRYFYPLYLAVSGVGALPAVLAYPNPRLHPDKFRLGLAGMSQRSGLDWILTERELESVIAPLVHKEGSTVRGLLCPLEWNDDDVQLEGAERKELSRTRSRIRGDDPVLLQHSSGTTGLQKPVVLSHKAVLDHVQHYGAAIGLRAEDRIVSWLPLYHDMGLIAAFHLPLAAGIPAVQIDPFEWAVAPIVLAEAVCKEHGTVSWMPNFAYNLMADKVHEEDLEGISLDSWRLIINCSEPVRHESHRRFFQRFARCHLKRSAFSTCYAMAETTFAVTQSEPGTEVRQIHANRAALSLGTVETTHDPALSRVCVSSGRTITGCEVRIVDEQGTSLPDRRVGEIAIRSVSACDGYRNYPEKTAEAFKDGWYHSGDLGFVDEEHCYVTGRKKDVIIVAGNNIYPEDVEDAVSQVPGVIPGRVIAFGEYHCELGSEQVSVAVETKISGNTGQSELKLAVVRAAAMVDVTVRKVYVVPPRWLIKSSAGKPSRRANCERLSRDPGVVWRL